MDDVNALRTKLIEERRFDEAKQLQARRLDANPEDPRLHHQMAWLLGALKDLGSAVDHELKACRLAPDDPQYPRAASKFFAQLGDQDNATLYSAKADALHEHRHQAFDEAQQKAKTIFGERIRAMVTHHLGAWLHRVSTSTETSRADALLHCHLVDSVADWVQFIPQRFEPTQTVTIEHVGRFVVTNPRDTLQKRLCRGMPWELPIVALLVELAARCDPNALMVEIGANIGAHTVPVARSFSGTVVAFEPVPENYQRLLQHLALNDIENCAAIQKACSREPGYGRMVRVLDENSGMAQLDLSADGTVEVTTLDQEMARRGRPAALIKIDVEGHEQAVIEGALETIRRDRPIIICELLGPVGQPMVATMKALGYGAEHFFRSDWVFFPQ